MSDQPLISVQPVDLPLAASVTDDMVLVGQRPNGPLQGVDAPKLLDYQYGQASALVEAAEQALADMDATLASANSAAADALADANRAESAMLLTGFYPDARAAVPAGVADGKHWMTNTADNQAVSVYKNNAGAVALVLDRFAPFDVTLIKGYRDQAQAAAAIATSVKATYSYNMLNPAAVVYTKRYSKGGAAVVPADANNLTISDWIAVKPGEYYVVSGNGLSLVNGLPEGGFFAGSGQLNASANITFTAVAGGFMFQVPDAGTTHVVLSLRTFDKQTLVAPVQMERGKRGTAWRAYSASEKVDPSQIPPVPISKLTEEPVLASDLLEDYAFNLIDPSKVSFAQRYSTGGKSIIPKDANLIARTDWIPVQEGKLYVVSGAGLYSPNAPQGGYFNASGSLAALDNITWGAPPSGSGKMFQVPTGLGITHVVISLATNAGQTALAGTVQMERGEVATAYKAYAIEKRVKASYLGSGSATATATATLDKAAWYKFVEGDDGTHLADKLPAFRKKWLLRNANVCVVNTGTSLTARSTEHCTDHPQATTRPPLMHSNNFASIIWDRLRWEGQQYRRYDAPTVFVEGGAFSTAYDLLEWDDGPYRNGLTRYSSAAAASVTFTVPIDAWQFNFIYRTDSVGCDATLAVAEGNGRIQVQNEAGAWVEANGYAFTMKEPAPVNRAVTVPSPVTNNTSIENMPSKGNTTYQKRLKMRCRSDNFDSRAATKSVTIARTGGGARFMYWGLEWSPRQHMITYINAARGSHNTGVSDTGLTRYQDNEVWGFKPDLMLFELPIHNDGAAAAGSYQSGYWAGLTNNFVFRADYELSMAGSAARLGLPMPEIAMFTSSIAWNFNGINDDGTLKFGMTTDGSRQMMTALDKYAEAHNYVLEHQPEAVSIHAAQRWVDAGKAIFGDLKSATIGSGKNGATLTNEGSHWNDTGSKIMAKAVLPLLRF